MDDSHRCSGCVYFSLVTMALCCLAVCILIPEWRKLQTLDLAGQIKRHEFERLQQEVTREKHLLRTLQSDPAAVTRLAQRQLNLTLPDRKTIPVSIPVTGSNADRSFTPLPRPLPSFLATLGQWYERYDLDRIFCDQHSRPILLVMSVGLIGVAVTLSCRRTVERPEPTAIRMN